MQKILFTSFDNKLCKSKLKHISRNDIAHLLLFGMNLDPTFSLTLSFLHIYPIS